MNYLQKIGNNTPIKEEGMELKMKQKIRRKGFKKTSGITLIALVVTIVVLLILSVVTLNFILGDDGLFRNASNSKEVQEAAQLKDRINNAIANWHVRKLANPTGTDINDLWDQLVDEGIIEANSDAYVKGPDENNICEVTTKDGYIINIDVTDPNNPSIGSAASSDSLPPRITDVSTSSTTNSIHLKVTTKWLGESGIVTCRYRMAKEEGQTEENAWVTVELNENFEANIINLVQDKIYEIEITATNENGSTVTDPLINVRTGPLEKASIDQVGDTEWNNNKAKIYIESSDTVNTLQYQVLTIVEGMETKEDGWINYDNNLGITDIEYNQVVYARMYDGYNGGPEVPLEIIDGIEPEEATFGTISKTNPEPNETITVTVTHTDDQSGVNITSCKWVYVKQNSKTLIGTNEADYTGGTFGSNGQTLSLKATTAGTYYLHILTVDNAGKKKESISDAITVATSGPKLKLSNGNIEPLTEANYGQYLGRAVKYTPANPGTATYYRLFYINFGDKYGENGTVYLKADGDANNANLSSYISYTSADGYAVMQALNPSWTKPTTMQENDNCVSWILDPDVWKDWKDTTTAGIVGNINYVVGSPSLEMYVDSYNKYLDTHPGLMKNGGTNPAQKLACEYVTSGYNAKGYRIGLLNDNGTSISWANTGYYQDNNSLISSSEANGMYNPGSFKNYWLASPSASNSSVLMGVYGNVSGVNRFGYNMSNAFCPIISLKSSVQLELLD